MELKVLEKPGREWDEFASRHTDLIFYQSIWSEVLRRGLGGQPLYFCLDEGGEVVAGLPAVLLRFGIFRILYASIPYGNLIGEMTFFPSLAELLEKEFRRRGIDQVRITESPFFESRWAGECRSVKAKCSLLDLRGLEQGRVREGYRGDIRRAIRKAEKDGLYLKDAASPEEAKNFYTLYFASMERNRAGAKYPLRWFEALYEILIRQGKADIRFAVKGDQVAAGVVLVHSPTSIHYLHNGSEPAHLKSRPNDLIVDDIIQRGVREGKAVLDFMGSDPGDLPLLRFKEKWGSQSRDLYTHIKSYHPLRCFFWETGKRWMGGRLGKGLSKMLRK